MPSLTNFSGRHDWSRRLATTECIRFRSRSRSRSWTSEISDSGFRHHEVGQNLISPLLPSRSIKSGLTCLYSFPPHFSPSVLSAGSSSIKFSKTFCTGTMRSCLLHLFSCLALTAYASTVVRNATVSDSDGFPHANSFPSHPT